MSVLSSKLSPHPGAVKNRKRVGRGPGSGTGKTSGRGTKGQLQRGPGARPGFEGGQMPIIRTMPKRGFSALSRVQYQIVNVKDLERLPDAKVTAESLLNVGLVRSSRVPVKILGVGEVKKAFEVKVARVSRSAEEKIKKAGGSVVRA